ncbi:PREDICTED: P2Y purinoceptor 1-like [Poecilia mexicana]|uniref:P2Y purinoceptor 1-like n=1 Tax=Poecilia mexicana TaxID=48701 RepID=UPI00072D98A4|nr:PREDICTED: P2Y purinoceptor 1-like [Poecilia mexicana]
MNKMNCTLDRLFEQRVLPALYIFVFVVGLVLNVWGMISLLHNWNKRRSINIFVLNLGLADMLYLLTHPFLIIYYLNETKWTFGEGFCLVTRFCFNLNLYGSIGFLTCICVYRYLAVVHPMKVMGKLTTTHSVVISILVWILVSVESSPDMLFPKHSGNKTERCFDTTSSKNVTAYLNYSLSWTFFGFCIPFAIIVGCYRHVTVVVCRSDTIKNVTKQHIFKLMVFLILLFSLCYAPYHVFKNLNLYSRVLKNLSKCAAWDSGVYVARQASRGVVSLNSALNPLVYLHVDEDMGVQFRLLLQGCRQIFSRSFKLKSSFVSVPQTEQDVERAL